MSHYEDDGHGRPILVQDGVFNGAGCDYGSDGQYAGLAIGGEVALRLLQDFLLERLAEAGRFLELPDVLPANGTQVKVRTSGSYRICGYCGAKKFSGRCQECGTGQWEQT